MTEIKSKKSKLNQPILDAYNYLVVPANYEDLMPSKVRSFSATEQSATLDIEGIGVVELMITETEEPNLIVMKPQNKVPFKFDLQWHLLRISENETEVFAVINADLNVMMKMMAKKPLTDFLDVQVYKLSEHLNK